MCGIAGFILGSQGNVDGESTVRAMTDAVVHRGPDGFGTYLDGSGRVGLGHRRLAIVDLSAAGHQPMFSVSKRYVITFNGEIYNFRRLRAELEAQGVVFRGHSDTEVMLAAIEFWGIPAAVRRFDGMFAFALWDSRDQELWLVRDRLGKKPLYFGKVNGSLIFGSELKSLWQFPGFERRIDRNSLTLLLRHSYIPAPLSIYEGIGKVRPGTLRRVVMRRGTPQIDDEQTYWSARDAFVRGRAERFQGNSDEAVEALDETLRNAVSDRMVADVPLGAFLSGGIDSSAVVALMQAQTSRPVKTFSIGFHDRAYNEAHHAAAVAKHLGTDHTEVYLSAADALSVVPLLPTMFDEPFSDSSQIPTYLVSKMARQHVTVALSGDGGDELFCGYPRYHKWRKVWSLMRLIPLPLRLLLARQLNRVPIDGWDRFLRPIMSLRRTSAPRISAGDRLHKLADALGASTPEAVYRRFVSHCMHPQRFVIGATEPETVLSGTEGPTDTDAFTEYMMMLDVLSYLPNDILTKVDRASMAVSLEVRGPLLDHRVVELAASMPLEFKLRDGTDKWMLRQVLSRYAPPTLFERSKMGFGVPIESWLRGPLRGWAEDLLAESALRSDAIFQVSPVRDLWADFIDRGYPCHYPLWDILVFQSWLRAAR